MSPFRNLPTGTREINRLVQKQFRAKALEWARRSNEQPWYEMARITEHRGVEEIVYGNKVINVINNHRGAVWPEKDALKCVANGKIGVVVGQLKPKNTEWKTFLLWLTKFEFSSQK